MSKHTPGPWISYERGDRRFALKQANGRHIGVIERDDDAYFLIAAPETAAERDRLREVNAELRDALERLLFSVVADEFGMPVAAALARDWTRWPDNTPNMVRPNHEHARAAIAKARGET